MPSGWVQDRKRGGVQDMEGKLNGNYLKVIPRLCLKRGQNELIGNFQMVSGDVISIRGRLWSISTFQQELKKSW